tara:strand:- start:137255 stop:138514 length:1260 start_codon:yes stop_codon:yes gene_type:complete
MAELKRQLSLGEAIVFAFASIVGGGILFLPSLVYSIAGSDLMIVWGVSAGLAFPLLVIMSDIVKRVPDGSGIEGFISVGLGDFAALAVPPLLLAIIFFGGAGQAVMVGRFMQLVFGGDDLVVYGTAFGIAFFCLIVPAIGLTVGKRIQQAITWFTVIFAVAVLVFAYPKAQEVGFDSIIPEANAIQPILYGVIAAFFAYVGLENMTFIAGELKNPERDFFLAALVAFVVYTGLLLSLSAVFGALSGTLGISEPTAGIVGLSLVIDARLAKLCAVFAFLAVQTNVTGWVWGLSRMVFKASETRKMPRYFSHLAKDDVPRRAVFLTGGLPIAGIPVLMLRPEWMVHFLVYVGGIGGVLYLLALSSYVLVGTRKFLRVLSLVVFLLISVNLSGLGLQLLVPLVIALIAYALGYLRGFHKDSE